MSTEPEQQVAPSPQTPGSVSATSCERCKRRKSRCDRSVPACCRCTDARLPCIYPSRRKPGFAAGHRQGLESKISALEAENLRLKAVLSTDKSARSRHVTAAPMDRPSEHAYAEVSMEDAGQEQTPVSTLPNPGSGEPSSVQQEAAPRPIDRVFQATYVRTRSIIEREPPLDIVVSSVSVYIRHIHPWMPFLDIQRVLDELITVRRPSLLLYAIFGATTPFLHDPRLDPATIDSYWKYCKRKVFVEATEEPSYSSLEACTILTLDLSGMTNGPQVWSRLAVVCKLAAQLRTPGGQVLRPSVQAHDQEPPGRPGSRQHAKLFWVIYALDSLISITTSQPPLLTNFCLRLFMASRSMTWQPPHEESTRRNTGGSMPPMMLFLFFLELLDISRRAHGLYLDYIAPPEAGGHGPQAAMECIAEYAPAPEAWMPELPAKLGLEAGATANLTSLPGVPPLLIMCHAYSHALTIYLNGLVEFSGDDLQSPEAEGTRDAARQRCVAAVRGITDLGTAYIDDVRDQLGWPFAWSLWSAARYTLAAAFRSSTPLPPDFHSLVVGLKKMGRYSQLSTKYWRLLCRAEEALRGLPSGGAVRSRLLAQMVDLRVPTSDLEDQFRVDPVLCYSADPSSRSSAVSVAGDVAPAGLGGQVLPFDEEHAFLSDPYFSDTWFTTPLFASSAFRMYPGDENMRPDGEGWIS